MHFSIAFQKGVISLITVGWFGKGWSLPGVRRTENLVSARRSRKLSWRLSWLFFTSPLSSWLHVTSLPPAGLGPSPPCTSVRSASFGIARSSASVSLAMALAFWMRAPSSCTLVARARGAWSPCSGQDSSSCVGVPGSEWVPTRLLLAWLGVASEWPTRLANSVFPMLGLPAHLSTGQAWTEGMSCTND